jgi:hypothetical protein
MQSNLGRVASRIAHLEKRIQNPNSLCIKCGYGSHRTFSNWDHSPFKNGMFLVGKPAAWSQHRKPYYGVKNLPYLYSSTKPKENTTQHNLGSKHPYDTTITTSTDHPSVINNWPGTGTVAEQLEAALPMKPVRSDALAIS